MWRCWCLVEIFCWCLVEILKMKCDQDLCLNFWYDFKKLLWQDELNPRVRCAFGNVLPFWQSQVEYLNTWKFWPFIINIRSNVCRLSFFCRDEVLANAHSWHRHEYCDPCGKVKSKIIKIACCSNYHFVCWLTFFHFKF